MPQRRCAAPRWMILLAGLMFSVPLFAASIDANDKYAWAENAGWLNWRDNLGSVQVVYTDHLEGYIWAENIGWIRLGSFSSGGAHNYANTANNDYGVNRAGTNLSGYAWSETAGWINFASTNGGGVTIDAATGRFDGYAWGENVGWIHLKGTATNAATYGVRVLIDTVALTSTLNPSTFGQSVTFTANVAGTPTPTGTMGFTADNVAITGCTAKALTSGAATCTTASLSVGSRAIAAVYSGDSNYLSASGNLTQTVNSIPPINGSCGSANGQTFSSAPTSGFCTTGTASTLNGSGPWAWSCTGSNGGSTANCSAQVNSGGGGETPINGTCGSANGQSFSSAPTSGFCTTGTTSALSGSGPWAWSCAGSNGGSTANCSAQVNSGGGDEKMNQTIGAVSFNPSTLAVGGTTTASATATSGLAVTFSSQTTGICTVSGNTVTGFAADTCTIVANQAGNASYNPASPVTQSLTVTAPPATVRLTVTTSGNGTVTSSPSGITCGSDCTEDYAVGTQVTLTATAGSGSNFTGWSGGCVGTAPTCTLTLSANRTVTATFSGIAPPRAAIGVLRNGQWSLDRNGNQAWDECGADSCYRFGQAGDMPVAGNWDGGSNSLIGVLRSGSRQWFLDRNGNGQWDGCVGDGCYSFGQIGDLPVAGDWKGGGFAQIGVFRNGQWYLDANGNGQWDECGADGCQRFGQLGDLPVVGDWNGDGKTEVGVFRAGSWYFDANGNGQWDGCGADGCQHFGQAGDYPIAGDWSGDGKVKIGVFRNGSWYFDNGNGQWDGCGMDTCIQKLPERPNSGFGLPGDLPAVGRW